MRGIKYINKAPVKQKKAKKKQDISLECRKDQERLRYGKQRIHDKMIQPQDVGPRNFIDVSIG